MSIEFLIEDTILRKRDMFTVEDIILEVQQKNQSKHYHEIEKVVKNIISGYMDDDIVSFKANGFILI